MYKDLIVGVVIVAAGKSKRMGIGVNKQHIILGDKPVLAHTLKAFDSVASIDRIVIVTSPEELDYCRKDIVEDYKIEKAVDIVTGGEERQHSIFNGLKALKGECDIVITHDGARPFVTEKVIEKSIEEACIYGASACAVPVKDTIKVSDSENFVIDTPDRSRLFAVQTPQTFKFDILYKAHVNALEEGFLGTDDTVLVERIGTRVKLFEGSYENIKITTIEDIYIAKSIFEMREINRI